MQTLLERDGMIGIETEIEGLEKTWTASVYKEPLKTYEPLPNGFNKELATAVLDRITANQHQWEQRLWRNITMLRPRYEGDRRDLLGGLAFEQHSTPVCHTTMCFAGWVAELTHADWVVDGSWIKGAADRGTSALVRAGHELLGMENFAELLVVAKGDFPYSHTAFGSLPKALRENLNDRGFSEDTHALSSVPAVARRELGLQRLECESLFSSSRSLQGIQAGIDYFASCSRKELANA